MGRPFVQTLSGQRRCGINPALLECTVQGVENKSQVRSRENKPECQSVFCQEYVFVGAQPSTERSRCSPVY
jgi:hypothetical protein